MSLTQRSLKEIHVRRNSNVNLTAHTIKIHTHTHNNAFKHFILQVRICSFNEAAGEEEEALEEMLSSYLHLPPDLCFSAIIYPFE